MNSTIDVVNKTLVPGNSIKLLAKVLPSSDGLGQLFPKWILEGNSVQLNVSKEGTECDVVAVQPGKSIVSCMLTINDRKIIGNMMLCVNVPVPEISGIIVTIKENKE